MDDTTLLFFDESGDPLPDHVDPDYPVFTLAGVAIGERDYARAVIPSLAELKIRHWGHEGIILHGIGIRRQQDEFSVLRNPLARGQFHEELSHLMRTLSFRFVLAVADKRAIRHRTNLYPKALHLCLRQLGPEITGNPGTRIFLESRGKRENAELTKAVGSTKLTFVEGSRNLAGLQLADLCAYPGGRHILNPDRQNRAWDDLLAKLSTGKGSLEILE